MWCQKCGARMACVDTSKPYNGAVYRRKTCPKCGVRVYTEEIILPAEDEYIAREAMTQKAKESSLKTMEGLFAL